MPVAFGTFRVQAHPQPALELVPGVQAGHLRFDKTFEGPLQGHGVVEVLSAGDPSSGSAAYVAIEYINGSLDGLDGSFMTTHTGSMEGGDAKLAIAIVPGSGTGALAGIRGSMNINIEDGVHHYSIDYTLPESNDGT